MRVYSAFARDRRTGTGDVEWLALVAMRRVPIAPHHADRLGQLHQPSDILFFDIAVIHVKADTHFFQVPFRVKELLRLAWSLSRICEVVTTRLSNSQLL